jgi:hypothetical protein
MELLLRMIRGEVLEPTTTMLPAKLKEGDSIASPREYSDGHRKGGLQVMEKNQA